MHAAPDFNNTPGKLCLFLTYESDLPTLVKYQIGTKSSRLTTKMYTYDIQKNAFAPPVCYSLADSFDNKSESQTEFFELHGRQCVLVWNNYSLKLKLFDVSNDAGEVENIGSFSSISSTKDKSEVKAREIKHNLLEEEIATDKRVKNSAVD